MHPSTDDRRPASPILDALREATRGQHAALDAALDLTDPRLTLARYVAFLRGSASALAPLERSLRALPDWPVAMPDADARWKAPALALDLGRLDPGGAPAGEVAVPTVDSLATAFGCAYVMEGSTLGGAVLARSIEPALGLSPERGTAYLRAYGDAVGPRWRSFLGRLAGFGDTLAGPDRGALVDAARGTFDAFAGALRAAGAAR